MKYCKKCGEKIENDAKYCHKCGTSLEAKRKNNWIVILVAVIVILIACILILSNNVKQHNKVDSQRNTGNQQEVKGSQSHKISQDKKLSADKLTDKEVAAVAALWAEKNLNGQFNVWNRVFYHPNNSQIEIENIPEGINLSDLGEGVEYIYLSNSLYSSNKLADKNQSYFYTISNNGNIKIINFYHVKENMQTQAIAPVGTVQLDEAVDFINQNHMSNEIMQNINNVQLVDNR